MAALPFITNFYLLAVVRILQYIALGSFITSDSSMIVYTMGPIKSRPFTNALHAFVGVGFFVGTFLVRPFLPSDASALKNYDEVCGANSTQDQASKEADAYEPEYLGGIQKVAWPYLISTLMCCLGFLSYLVLGCLPLRMPRYIEDQQEEGIETVSGPKIHHWKQVVGATLLYYAMSCGIERIFQSMAYTYALCGPLALLPAQAVYTDTAYNGGFMVGRLVSIFLGKLTR